MVTKKEQKQKLRKYYKEKRNALTPAEMMSASEFIAKRLWSLEAYQSAEHMMFYVSAASEVDTHVLIKQAIAAGKKVYVPLTHTQSRTMEASRLKDFEAELQLGGYDILEPTAEFTRICPPDMLDLVIAPGLAFDRQGYRLGYGAGYYDKYLANVRPNTLIIGLAYDFQLADTLPHDDLDIPCDCIITPTGVVKIEQQK